ncbi:MULTISPECIES: imidazolonepropionase-like domain-containing protein [Streptomyces]|uniref:Aminodeoxyfutalosine deaminase/Imidazolonepropionase-like composite domain-containing protein n=2 Tax=Streptomyces TaxID=1883 RepID=A0ABV9IZL9_9ACTN
MLTIHTADLLLPADAAPVPDGAVVVDGSRIAAFGPYEDMAETAPDARVRRWPGVLTPGLRQWHALWLLRSCYHPDPREADELGELPLWGDRLAALDLTDARWAGSVRRGLQRMLRHGTTALAATGTRFRDPVIAQAVARSGLAVVPHTGGPGGMLLGERPDLDPFAEGYDLAGTVHTPLTVGGRADLAVFDVPDEATLRERGASCCVATVLDGRLVYRSR